MWGSAALLVGAGAGALAISAAGSPVNTADRAAIETIVRDYILAHPEILPEAMRNLEAREAKLLVDANRRRIETPFAGAWEGAADGDVTLVEFFDYNCSYCRASVPAVTRLLTEDRKLKVVYRELPILSEASVAAARHGLAIAQQGKYAPFHRALFAAGASSSQTIADAIKTARGDFAAAAAAATKPEITREIEQNRELQRTLGLNGTPGWVVGDQILMGAVGYEELKKAIATARRE